MRYHQLSILSVLAAVLLPGLTAPAKPPWDDMRTKHAWDTVPANWEYLGPPPNGTTIDLHVALNAHNEDALIEALYEVSSPEHPKYGEHLSKEDVANLVAPHPDTLDLVHSWLAHHGVPFTSISTTHGGGWLTLTDVPVSQANKLLRASYQLYRPAGTNDSTILRTVGYALPAVLHTHVETVVPTTHFASVHTLQKAQRRPSTRAAAAKVGSREPVKVLSSRQSLKPPGDTTPEILRWLYKTSGYVPAATAKNSLGVVGFNNDFPSPTDLRTFMISFRQDAIDAIYTVEKVNGGNYDPSDPGLEGNLNMQYAQLIASPTPFIFYSVAGGLHWAVPSNKIFPDDIFVSWLKYLLKQTVVPRTIDVAFGLPENRVPLEYARAVCKLFSQLGARGVSVLFATGDAGVGPDDPANCKDGSKVRFMPMFPASCPWVTSVGGTMRFLPEIGAPFSGGGFSNYFPRPDYQNKLVPPFLKKLGRQYKGLYNSAGRGIPDISAQSINFVLSVNFDAYIVNGTSCAVPVVAGIISLLNDFLLANGKSPLGFLNPWLYGKGSPAINDIKSGSNPGCGTKGFSAVAGWDPVTGVGTPDFVDMQQELFKQRIRPSLKWRPGVGRDVDEYFLTNSSTREMPAY